MPCDLLTDLQLISNRVIKEGTKYEFKESFNWANKEKYAKVMASFANSSGGYILFGIKDDGSIIGMNDDDFEDRDSADITKYLNSIFRPAIIWSKSICECYSKKIGVIKVEEAKEKPIISIKDGQEIKEGDIFYRYTALTQKIRYSELKSIIDHERRKFAYELLNGLKMMVDKGPETIKLLDLDKLRDAGEGPIYIIESESSDLEVKLDTASERGTSERAAWKIVKAEGRAIPVPSAECVNINSELIINSFLDRELPSGHDPKLYVQQLPYETSGFVPVYFFIKKANMSVREAIGIIEKAKSTTRGKSTLIKRLTKSEYDFSSHADRGVLERFVSSERSGNELEVQGIKGILQAIRIVPKDYLEDNWFKITEIIRYVYQNHYTDPKLRPELRWAICYIDKTLFS